MKTIAVSIDEDLLVRIDRLARSLSRRAGGGPKPNRSKVIREAVRDFLLREQRRRQESRERQVFASNRERLARQMEALVGEQAEP